LLGVQHLRNIGAMRTDLLAAAAQQ